VKQVAPVRSSVFVALLLVASSPCLRAQSANPSAAAQSVPADALGSALTAACREDAAAFAAYLTAPNAAAFRALPAMQQAEFLKRFVLLDAPGNPLLSTGSEGHPVMRCESGGLVSEMGFGATELRDNLAFIPVDVRQAPPESQRVRFGLVRESGSWKLLSVGLLLLDVPAMQQQWAEADLAAREAQAVAQLRKIADALKSYQTAFGRLPETLAWLGPADKGGISPEHASMVDEQLAAGETSDYRFRYSIVPAGSGFAGSADESERNKAAGFALAATPVAYGKTGRRSFYLDAAGILRGADKQGAVATSTDPKVEGPVP
jgi:hypothetical protein